MNVLLTGSSGWLGQHLAPRLRDAGHHVVGLDVVAGEQTKLLGSIADPAVVARAFERGPFAAVIHAAVLHKPDIVRYTPQAFVDVNVTGTLNLLSAARANGVARFVFTSTTSLMISDAVRAGVGDRAVWIDENFSPLAPRNIYGVTKLSAEHLCRIAHLESGMPVIVLRTARFFPEEDDMAHAIEHGGPNTKANEFLYRRLTVEDAAEAHLIALDKADEIGFDTFIISAPTPFEPAEGVDLKRDAPSVIARHFPDVAEVYERRGWSLPRSIDRVYDAGHAERVLGFRAQTDFRAVLDAMRTGKALPFAHVPSYVSPLAASQTGQRPA